MDLTRVHMDIDAGRRWKALDRLQGMRAHAPADQEVLELLGRVRADMGDLPAAGLAWYLTDGEDPRREAAFAAMRERFGPASTELAPRLKVRAPIDAFPPRTQARLRELQGEVEASGLRWDLTTDRPRVRWAPPEPMPWRDRAGVGAGCLGAALIFAVPWLLGLKEIFY